MKISKKEILDTYKQDCLRKIIIADIPFGTQITTHKVAEILVKRKDLVIKILSEEEVEIEE